MAAGKGDSPLVVDGIKLNATVEDAQDFEIAELTSAYMDESLSDEERSLAYTHMLVKTPKILFGSNWDRIKRELREKNDGRLDNEMVQSFLTSVFEALNRKK